VTTPLERLVELAPPAERPAPADWAEAEEDLGLPLPEDYQRLVDTYGPGEFDGHIRLRGPQDTPAGRGLVSMNDGYLEELEDVWEMNGGTPAQIEEADEGTTLVVWARAKDGDTLNWLAHPDEPAERWTVLVLDADGGSAEHYGTTATGFLAELLAGDVDSAVLSSELTSPHVFRPTPGA
jgi:SUKH superfamily protein